MVSTQLSNNVMKDGEGYRFKAAPVTWSCPSLGVEHINFVIILLCQLAQYGQNCIDLGHTLYGMDKIGLTIQSSSTTETTSM